MLFTGKEEIQDENKDNCGCSVWPLKTDYRQRVKTSLHFLVVTLYTEQASIHQNDLGNVVISVMHKLLLFIFEKGHFLLNIYKFNMYQHF